MKAKFWVSIAAGIILTACETGVAAEDKTFTSSGQILPGEEWNNVYVYNDDTIVDMLGGLVDSIGTYDASTVNVTGGNVSTLVAHECSTANISGGSVHIVFTSDQASVNFSGNASAVSLSSEDIGIVNMTGGTVDHISAYNSGTINLYGGNIEYIFARNSSVVNIVGYDLVKTSSGGSYGYGLVYGLWANGTAFTIDLNGSQTYSHINLVEIINVRVDIAPDTLNLASKGKWISCKIWLPEDYNVADVNSASVFLEDEIPAEWIWFNEEQNVVTAKFSRSDLEDIIQPGLVELTVTGELTNGTQFEGIDTIKVIDKSRGRLAR